MTWKYNLIRKLGKVADNLNILNVARLIENNPEVLTSDITRKFRSTNKNLIFASPATAREEGLF